MLPKWPTKEQELFLDPKSKRSRHNLSMGNGNQESLEPLNKITLTFQLRESFKHHLGVIFSLIQSLSSKPSCFTNLSAYEQCTFLLKWKLIVTRLYHFQQGQIDIRLRIRVPEHLPEPCGHGSPRIALSLGLQQQTWEKVNLVVGQGRQNRRGSGRSHRTRGSSAI